MPHQLRYAGHFSVGLKRHNIKPIITPVQTSEADYHVVIGPHYAKESNLNKDNVVLIDRAYWMQDPICVSVGWMNSEGGRDFIAGDGRKRPEVKECRAEAGSIFLADYNGPIDTDTDEIRLHPVRAHNPIPLNKHLRKFRKAIGYRTTALVEAALMGLEIDCRDKQNILANDNWLDLLAYADWHYEEIESGETWEHLLLSRN